MRNTAADNLSHSIEAGDYDLTSLANHYTTESIKLAIVRNPVGPTRKALDQLLQLKNSQEQ